MSTLEITVTGTYISPLSDYNTYDVLHGGYLKDPFAAPLSFYYPSTANGGLISTIYSETLSGGEFELTYDDLVDNIIVSRGYYMFCDTEVIFNFSDFDQTESKIIKMVFDPKNGNDLQTFNCYVSNNEIFYPVLSSIKTKYYPSEDFYTYYSPYFKLYYLDGNIVNLTIPLTSLQCGIFDSYKTKAIVDVIPLYDNSGNVITVINDTDDNNLIFTNISTHDTYEPSFDTIEIPLSALSPLALRLLKLKKPQSNDNPFIPQPVIVNKLVRFNLEWIKRFVSGDFIELFSIPEPPQPVIVNGIARFNLEWIKRFVSGDFIKFFR